MINQPICLIMKTETHPITFKIIIIMLFSISIVASLQSCKSDKKQNKIEDSPIVKENVINILTEGMDFQMADTITSGWNTFKYKNA